MYHGGDQAVVSVVKLSLMWLVTAYSTISGNRHWDPFFLGVKQSLTSIWWQA